MSIVLFIFDLYARIICSFVEFKKKYIQRDIRAPFFQIDSVVNAFDDITDYYMFNGSFDLDRYSKSVLSWSVKNTQYKFLLSKDSADLFPPYSFHALKHCIPENKIVTAYIQNADDNSLENVGKLIKQIAGPKQNFYRDVGLLFKTSDLWGTCNKTLSVVTTKTTKTFDLSKDNVLEL